MILRSLALTLCLSFFSGVFASSPIKVGIVAGPSVQLFEVVKKIAKKKYNLDIQPVVFTDYIIPNEAVNSGDIDINVFQTASFLNQSIAKRNYKIVSIGNTFIYPMGIYSKKIKNISELKAKATLGIPNDTSNEGRALLLLAQSGVIKLKPGVGEFPTVQDIVDNSKNIKIMTMDASQLARVVPDVDAVVLNNDFVKNAGFKLTDALVSEKPATAQPYINVIVVKTTNKDKKEYKQIVDVLHSKEVFEKNLELYPGAVKAY